MQTDLFGIDWQGGRNEFLILFGSSAGSAFLLLRFPLLLQSGLDLAVRDGHQALHKVREFGEVSRITLGGLVGLPRKHLSAHDSGMEYAPMCAEKSSASDCLNKSLQRLHDLNDALRINSERGIYARRILHGSLVERYLKQQLSVLLYVDVLRESDVVGGILDSPPSACCMHPKLVLKFEVLNGDASCDGNEKSMLVHYVKIVESPNGEIPSLVRPYIVQHESEEFRTGLLYLSAFHRSLEFVSGLSNGKLGEFIDGGRNNNLDDFEPRIVERAFKVVDYVSDKQRDVRDPSLIDDVMLKALVASIRVNLDARSATVGNFGQPMFKVSDVLVGPFDLCSGVAKLHTR